MDSLTQIVLGAAVAEAVAGKQLGVKAALFGGIAGTIPDLDVFFRGLYTPLDAALVHRGFSHSLLFALLAGPTLAFLSNTLQKSKLGFKKWFWFWFLGIVTHPLLDIFTNYGTQFFWPFSPRITFNTVFVIDPLYTLPFLFFLVGALFMKRNSLRRRRWNWIGIGYSSLYLFWGAIVKLIVLNNSSEYLKMAEITPNRTMVTPMPLTSFYWTIVAEDDSMVYVTYKSLFSNFDPKDVQRFPKNKLHAVYQKLPKATQDEIDYITNGFYINAGVSDTLIVYDMRFGTAQKITNHKNPLPIMGYQFNYPKNGPMQQTMYRNQRFDLIDFNRYLAFIIGK